MRNSVKATVDAYDGTVKLYEFDDTDPVLKAWNKAFGGDLIQPKAEIPAELAAHFRYPADLFKVQRNLLTKFHVTNPRRLLLRPGLLAGAERAGRAGQRPEAAAVLPVHPVPGAGRARGSSSPRRSPRTAGRTWPR